MNGELAPGTYRAKNGDLIHCRVPTDHLIVAGVSNWGAYALAAGIYVLRGVKPPFLAVKASGASNGRTKATSATMPGSLIMGSFRESISG